MWAFLGGLCALVVFLGFPALVWVIVYWDIKRQENRPLTEAERRQAITDRYVRAMQLSLLNPANRVEYEQARADFAAMVERDEAERLRRARNNGN